MRILDQPNIIRSMHKYVAPFCYFLPRNSMPFNLKGGLVAMYHNYLLFAYCFFLNIIVISLGLKLDFFKQYSRVDENNFSPLLRKL